LHDGPPKQKKKKGREGEGFLKILKEDSNKEFKFKFEFKQLKLKLQQYATINSYSLLIYKND
jgi:hypothetical protein